MKTALTDAQVAAMEEADNLLQKAGLPTFTALRDDLCELTVTIVHGGKVENRIFERAWQSTELVAQAL